MRSLQSIHAVNVRAGAHVEGAMVRLLPRPHCAQTSAGNRGAVATLLIGDGL
jgi:hypothetical protein